MKARMLVIVTLSVGLAAPQVALPWAAAVHGYAAAQLGYRGVLEKEFVYGSVAGDTFNFLFQDAQARQYLYVVTHGLTPLQLGTVLPVLYNAEGEREEAVALGFVSHNNFNAGDMVAHGYPYDDPSGYIIQKAIALQPEITYLLAQAGLQLPPPLVREISHVLVEYAADLLMREADRSIGALLLSSAAARGPGFPELLAASYADGLAAAAGVEREVAAAWIVDEEASFRGMTAAYGAILQKGDAQAFEEMVVFLTGTAQQYLAMFGFSVPAELVPPLVRYGLSRGMALCAPDLMDAVGETVEAMAAALAPLE